MAGTNDFQITLGAKLDASAQSSLATQLTQMQNLAVTVTKAQLSDAAVQQIRDQLSNISVSLKLANSGEITAEIESLSQAAGNAVGAGIEEGAKNAYTKAADTTSIENVHEQLVKLSKSNSDAVKEYKSEIQQMMNDTKAGSSVTVEELGKIKDRYTEITESISQSDKAYASNQKAAEKAFSQLGQGAETYVAKVQGITSSLEAYGVSAEQAGVDTDGLTEALAATQQAEAAWAADKTSEAKAKEFVADFTELKAKLAECQEEMKTFTKTLASDSSISKLHTDIQNFVNDNTAALGDYGNELESMLSRTAAGSSLSKTELGQIREEFTNIKSACSDAGLMTDSFFNSITKGIKQFLGIGSVAQTLNTTFRVLKNAVTDVKDLDTALIDLRKTTTMTTGELEDFYYAANDVAKQMGVTTEEIISQAAAWSRLGYSSQEAATQMAALSSQFAAISPGMDVDTATNGLVSVMKAYGYEVDDVLDGVMSKINAVGNTAATTNEEIVEMLERSSSAMAVGNTSMEETIALETAAKRHFNSLNMELDCYGWMYRNMHHRTHLIAENA